MSWEIIGNEWAVELLQSHIQNNRIRHAYLFSGPAGVGRRTLALRLVQALNCEKPLQLGEPCRSCRICRQIENMQHPDLFVVQAEEKGGVLKVDQIRQLQQNLSLHPFEARYKVALLLNFEQAHISAMNAILKTLEEPTTRVILLLTAESPEKLIPTIVSRCETLRMRPVSINHLADAIGKKMSLSQDECRLLAHVSAGRPGFAFRMAQEPEILENRNEYMSDLFDLLAENIVERFTFAEKSSKDRMRLKEILNTWLSFWRDVVLLSSQASVPILNVDFLAQVEYTDSGLDLDAANRITRSIERAIERLDRYVNPRLIIEVLLLDFPHVRFPESTA